MFGTLVNIALGKMPNLESFSWDMPTGILRDVFMTLHDMSNRNLKSVHVRFHDNTANGHLPESRRVETPTFKGFKNLRQLSALDIDELQYLKEISCALVESVDTLRELRIGLAARKQKAIEGWNIHATGGVPVLLDGRSANEWPLSMGIILARILNSRYKCMKKAPDYRKLAIDASIHRDLQTSLDHLSVVTPSDAFDLSTLSAALGTYTEPSSRNLLEEYHASNCAASTCWTSDEPPRLKLETLELERVPISARAMMEAIDWTHLTSITLLNCVNHEGLWKTLRKQYPPIHHTSLPAKPVGYRPTAAARRAYSDAVKKAAATGAGGYQLKIKKIHTDCVSQPLLSFIRETLAPHTLEVLFLQERYPTDDQWEPYTSSSNIEHIFNSAVKRHRKSLVKLLIANCVPTSEYPTLVDTLKWRMTRGLLTWITEFGNMPKLRELGISLDYRDWHHFLRRLPGLPQLRSLYVPHVRGAVQVPAAISKEMAWQVLDVVTLRPEVGICYVAVGSNCFELLEEDEEGDDPEDEDEPTVDVYEYDDDGEGDEDGDEGEDEEEFHDAADGGPSSGSLDWLKDDGDTSLESGGLSGEDEGGLSPSSGSKGGKGSGKSQQQQTRIRIQEILFYEDRVAIFRARAGRL